MKIKIKALADIEFLSAKVDRKHNIIHVQARFYRAGLYLPYLLRWQIHCSWLYYVRL